MEDIKNTPDLGTKSLQTIAMEIQSKLKKQSKISSQWREQNMTTNQRCIKKYIPLEHKSRQAGRIHSILQSEMSVCMDVKFAVSSSMVTNKTASSIYADRRHIVMKLNKSLGLKSFDAL